MHVSPNDPARSEAALRRIAERMLRDVADRDDAIQEMWLASLEAGMPMERAADGWMVNTLRHRAKRIWERRARRARAEAEADPPQPMPDPTEELDRLSLRQLMHETLERLSSSQAEVIRAHFFEDIALEEIARREGAPAGTIRARLSRGLAEMRRRLDERTGDPRLTALALIRGFDWPPRAVMAGATTSSLGFVALVAGLAALTCITIALGWWLLHGSSDVRVSKGLEVASASERGQSSLRSSDQLLSQRALVPIADVSDTGAANMPESAASGGGSSSDAGPAANEMRLTILGLDEHGRPRPGYSAKAWLPADRSLPFVGPAGSDGKLTLTVTEDNLWQYWQESIEGTIVERTLEQGTFVKVSLTCPQTARVADLHVPFMPGTEREAEVRFASRPGELEGIVVDRAGAPIPGVKIRARIARDWEEHGMPRYMEDDHRSTHQDGRFHFSDLNPDRTRFELTCPGFVAREVTYTIEPGVRLEQILVLDPAVPVVGIVRDGTGRPVVGARVLAERDATSPGAWIRTAADGSFRLAALPPGIHRLLAYGPVGTEMEHSLCAADLTLVREEVEWNPILTHGQELTVQVLDAEGWPLPDQRVLFRPEGAENFDTWWDVVLTDAEGLATVMKVPDLAIRAELRAGKGDLLRGMARVPIRVLRDLRARSEPYTLQLQPGDLDLGRVRGSFRWADGSPCVDGSLSIRGWLGATWELCDLQQDAFEVDDLPAGEHILLLGRPFGGYWATKFRLAPGQDLDLGVLQLPRTGTLRVINRWPKQDREGRRLETVLSVTIPGFDGEHYRLRSDLFDSPLARDFEYFPGAIEVHVCVAELEVDLRSVSVRSGERTEVELVPDFDPLEPFVPVFEDRSKR